MKSGLSATRTSGWGLRGSAELDEVERTIVTSVAKRFGALTGPDFAWLIAEEAALG